MHALIWAVIIIVLVIVGYIVWVLICEHIGEILEIWTGFLIVHLLPVGIIMFVHSYIKDDIAQMLIALILIAGGSMIWIVGTMLIGIRETLKVGGLVMLITLLVDVTIVGLTELYCLSRGVNIIFVILDSLQ